MNASYSQSGRGGGGLFYESYNKTTYQMHMYIFSMFILFTDLFEAVGISKKENYFVTMLTIFNTCHEIFQLS